MRNLNRDLKTKSAMFFKVVLFLMILVLSIILNLTESNVYLKLLSIVMIMWSSSRIYYFMFYVIEHYLDRDYRFSSIYSCVCYLLKAKK